ncbi:hypothetical protein NDN08_004631 [Rhodosorus marinus]|uniref:Aminoacyl-tRNA hydrolase n=1 Tax=Rhodosorus marinus TaxID=101924 RepID=A0AAV8ULT9_9RHOD|nr:hypothetical protein NDN08_004631 [Rhodosorus marinus]
MAFKRSACKRTSTPKLKAMTLCGDDQMVRMLAEKGTGWTLRSEQWNGRLAMLGPAVVVTTEQLNLEHTTVVKQLAALIGQ